MTAEPKLTISEVVTRLGPLDELRRGLADFRQSARTLSSDRPRLIDAYLQQWVAILGGEVVAHDVSLAGVLNAIDERRVPRSRVLVRFIDENVRTMIL